MNTLTTKGNINDEETNWINEIYRLLETRKED